MRIEPVEILVQRKDRTERRIIPIGSVAGARFSSRDVAGMRKELDAALARGESGTKTNPAIFHIGRYLLTQASEFEVQGPLTGGEAEIVAIRDGNEILITTGSDQCDRELDPLFQDKPKQMCPHPIARYRLALQRGVRTLGSASNLQRGDGGRTGGSSSGQCSLGAGGPGVSSGHGGCAGAGAALHSLLRVGVIPGFGGPGHPRPFASRRDRPRRGRRLSGPAARPGAGSNH